MQVHLTSRLSDCEGPRHWSFQTLDGQVGRESCQFRDWNHTCSRRKSALESGLGGKSQHIIEELWRQLTHLFEKEVSTGVRTWGESQHIIEELWRQLTHLFVKEVSTGVRTWGESQHIIEELWRQLTHL